MGTTRYPKYAYKCEKFQKIDFLFLKIHYNGTQNGTPMVPKVSNGTQNGTQVVPKHPDTFSHMMNFHHFSSPKNGHMTTLATILGTIAIFWVPSTFFWITYHVSCLRKKRRSLSRDIYLPSLLYLIFYQIHNFHLWDTLHFLGTIEYSMVPKNFTIVKYEFSAF